MNWFFVLFFVFVHLLANPLHVCDYPCSYFALMKALSSLWPPIWLLSTGISSPWWIPSWYSHFVFNMLFFTVVFIKYVTINSRGNWAIIVLYAQGETSLSWNYRQSLIPWSPQASALSHSNKISNTHEQAQLPLSQFHALFSPVLSFSLLACFFFSPLFKEPVWLFLFGHSEQCNVSEGIVQVCTNTHCTKSDFRPHSFTQRALNQC